MKKKNREIRKLWLKHQSLQLFLAGHSALDIADELGIGAASVRRYVKEAEKRWKEFDLAAREHFTQRELAKLNLLEVESIRKLGRSADTNDITNHFRLMLAIVKRRCKILGLDAPDRIELAGKDGKPIETKVQHLTDTELDKIIAGKT